MQTLTAREIDRYVREGHAVHVMPRKGLVRIDGFRLFRMTDAAIEAAIVSPPAYSDRGNT